jgi:hypothetical protein
VERALLEWVVEEALMARELVQEPSAALPFRALPAQVPQARIPPVLYLRAQAQSEVVMAQELVREGRLAGQMDMVSCPEHLGMMLAALERE